MLHTNSAIFYGIIPCKAKAKVTQKKCSKSTKNARMTLRSSCSPEISQHRLCQHRFILKSA